MIRFKAARRTTIARFPYTCDSCGQRGSVTCMEIDQKHANSSIQTTQVFDLCMRCLDGLHMKAHAKAKAVAYGVPKWKARKKKAAGTKTASARG